MIRVIARRLRIAATVMFLAAYSLTWAGKLTVSPIRIHLSEVQHTAVLTVQNEHSEPALMQLQAMSWEQDGNGDQYQLTRDLIATPTVFLVQPGEQQLVRIGLRQSPAADKELAYRLFLQEVPSGQPSSAVRVALRFSLPVFVAPKNPLSETLIHWQVRREADGQVILRAVNHGNAHIQITHFSVSQADGTMIAEQRDMQYLLAGRYHQWLVTPAKLLTPGTLLHINAMTDAGEMEQNVSLEQ